MAHALDQPSLLDLLPKPSTPCHDCGNPLTEKERLLPATCEKGLTCTGCCTDCHHQALDRIMRRCASYGGQHLGFRIGTGVVPMAADRAALHVLLDELGCPQ